MQPQVGLARDIAYGLEVIDRAGIHGSGGGDNGKGDHPFRLVIADSSVEGDDTDAVSLIDRYAHECSVAESEQFSGLARPAMRLSGAIAEKPWQSLPGWARLQPMFAWIPAGFGQCGVSGHGQREGARRGGAGYEQAARARWESH